MAMNTRSSRSFSGTTNIASLATEVKKNRFSQVSALTEEDVVSILQLVSEYVQRQMIQQKGVSIQGLGTFTFSMKLTDKNVVERPLFLISEKLVKLHSLQATKSYTSGQIPVVPLNFSALANDGPYTRETIELCVQEVIQTLSRSVSFGKNVNFEFHGIGRLAIRDSRVKMKFFRLFVASLDSSGEMERALRKRSPGSSGLSIISTPRFRPESADTVSLPQLTTDVVEVNSLGQFSSDRLKPKMPTIAETDEKDVEQAQQDSTATTCAEAHEQQPSRKSLVPTPACLFVGKTDTPGFPPDHPVRQHSRSHKARCPSTQPLAMCTHPTSSKQDLCYVCHQRATRNVPVHVKEEEAEREELEELMLLEYRHQKDLAAFAKQDAKQQSDRKINQDMAHYNLDVAERIKTKKKESQHYPSSFLFRNRPLTPPKQPQQASYGCTLDEQVAQKQLVLKQLRDKEEACEKEEQIALAKHLAEIDEAYRKKKAERTVLYSMALSEQIDMKQKDLKACTSKVNQPVFGVDEFTVEKVDEERERAKALFEEQLAVAMQKKMEIKERKLREKEQEAKILKKIREELVEDQSLSHRWRVAERKKLEEMWHCNAKEQLEHKKMLAKEENEPAILLQQQCERYPRCKQCQRKKNYAGKSNLLHESHYTSGARLMV